MAEPLIMIVVMFAVMYFFMIRPANNRKKKAQEMRDSLKKGDTITTFGGLVGKIVHVGPDTIIVETSEDRVRVELTKWAVSSIGVQKGEQPDLQDQKSDDKKDDKKSLLSGLTGKKEDNNNSEEQKVSLSKKDDNQES